MQTKETTDNEIRDQIRQAKQQIKDLAVEQVKDKKLLHSNHSKLPEPHYIILWRAQERARNITSWLIQYHELRGTGKEAAHFYKI